MTINWEDVYSFWSQSPDESEELRCQTAISEVRKAVARSPKLKSRRTKTFVQGSYRNRVNVLKDSDVDVGVMLYDCFYSEYPIGKSAADFGVVDAGYTFQQFKNELEEALVTHFGRLAVERGSKALKVRASPQRVEADVVPLFEFRQYWDNGSYRAGVALVPDQGQMIQNYPERLVDYWPPTPLHYENGVSKNTATLRRFKSMVRIFKKLRNLMEESGTTSASRVPGYLLECMIWNVPDIYFLGNSWSANMTLVLGHLWSSTKSASSCTDWREVDNIKYLFHTSQPWTQQDAHLFINDIWSFVGMKRS